MAWLICTLDFFLYLNIEIKDKKTELQKYTIYQYQYQYMIIMCIADFTPLVLFFIVSAGDHIVALSTSLALDGDFLPYPEL